MPTVPDRSGRRRSRTAASSGLQTPRNPASGDGHPRLVGLCRGLCGHRKWLWTFLDDDAVEPTNNASERSLRCVASTALGLHPLCSVGGLGCFWRKLSFDTQSAADSRFVETMLTEIETCRQQSRDVYAYVTQAVEAHFANEVCTSLVSNP